MASIDAIVIVSALAVDPFIQLVVDVEGRLVAGQQNLIYVSRAVRYSKGSSTTAAATSIVHHHYQHFK